MILRPVAEHAVCNLRVDVIAPDSSTDTLRRVSSRWRHTGLRCRRTSLRTSHCRRRCRLLRHVCAMPRRSLDWRGRCGRNRRSESSQWRRRSRRRGWSRRGRRRRRSQCHAAKAPRVTFVYAGLDYPPVRLLRRRHMCRHALGFTMARNAAAGSRCLGFATLACHCLVPHA